MSVFNCVELEENEVDFIEQEKGNMGSVIFLEEAPMRKCRT